jgi:hypothetical protein
MRSNAPVAAGAAAAARVLSTLSMESQQFMQPRPTEQGPCISDRKPKFAVTGRVAAQIRRSRRLRNPASHQWRQPGANH